MIRMMPPSLQLHNFSAIFAGRDYPVVLLGSLQPCNNIQHPKKYQGCYCLAAKGF
jgi:hypothetical protein